MARGPRLFIPGLSQHVIQRGNNRGAVFVAPHEYRHLLALLCETSQKHCVGIHGYVLMTNHIHLIATPSSASGLPKMMQGLGSYVRDFNRRHERTGTLFEGRYRASLIHDERYWLTCLRYIELNPVRAGLVPSPELYEWSSYGAHALGRLDPLLTPHPLLLEGGRTAADRQLAWQATCGAPIDDGTLFRIRHAIQASRPLKDALADSASARTWHPAAGQVPAV
jgi:putative transposase